MSFSLVSLTIVWVFVILSLLVIVHEFGHFIAAKLLGVHVHEFGLGYPPRVKKLFRWWQTDFTFNALPFGGFVRLYGDDAESIEQGSKAAKKDDQQPSQDIKEQAIPDSKKFNNQPQWSRLLILVAGVVFNFIFGTLVFAIIYSVKGIPEPQFVEVADVTVDSPAQQAGLQSGDVIVELSNDSSIRPVEAQQVIDFVTAHQGETIHLKWRRNDQHLQTEVAVRSLDQVAEGDGALGVLLNQVYENRFYPWYEMPWRGVLVGLEDAIWVSQMVVSALADMFYQLTSQGEVPQDVAGIVGITQQAVQVEAIKQGWTGTFHTVAVLSINLAIMNILPIPMLDGGRMIFVVAETFLGSKRRRRWEQKANTAGFIFLLSLIVLITAKDIIGLF